MSVLPDQYPLILSQLKAAIRQSRLKALLSANAEMLLLYWKIGKTILDQQDQSGWGSKVIEQLAKDLKSEFTDMHGLSVRNLKYMRQFAKAYSNSEFVQASLAQITWYHHITLLSKVKDESDRLSYIQETARNGWSRDIMVMQIESGYLKRKGKGTSNFESRLPPTQSDLAQQVTKDPYLFDFISLAENYKEKGLEDALTNHIVKFLLELGAGFAFVGRQYHLDIGDSDFYIDLLFYHLKLRSYVVIELKTGKFIPEYAGKLNFYLSVVDDILKTDLDQPTIGLLICQDKNKVVAEYALKDMNKPIGIAEYKITDSIPQNLKGNLPSIEELEKELESLAKKDKDFS